MAWFDLVTAYVSKVKAADWNSLISYVRGHASDHQAGGIQPIKLDSLAAPDAGTLLDVSIAKHGLCPVLPNNALLFLDGTGHYTAPPGIGNVVGPGSSVANNLPKFADASGKVLSDSAVPVANVVVTSDSRLSDARTAPLSSPAS